MGKDILYIISSPRKGGNSDLLADQFIKGAEESGNTVDKLYLVDKNMGYCRGCMGCVKNGECIIDDDVSKILDRMIASDVIVLSTPVYFFSMNSIMKTLIDRTITRYDEITNKEFYYIVTASIEDEKYLKNTFRPLRAFTDCLPGSIPKDKIAATGITEKGAVLNSPVYDEIYEIGKNV